MIHEAMADLLRQWQNRDPAPVFSLREPMSAHTTFQTGGPADIFAEPSSEAELAQMMADCRERGIPFFVLGRGSNVLVSDDGYRGVILHIGESFARMERRDTQILAGAGVTLLSLSRFAWKEGLTGLEFAGGIPGTLGGALFMNAGAYGGEMKDVVQEVRALRPDGTICLLTADELEMGYRTSRIQREGWTALSAMIRLEEGDPEAIGARMRELAEKRRSRQPLEYPSAGSTFKRPPGYFAGKLIQDAGLSGYTAGGACVSSKHCGFVVNQGRASSSDVLAVCRHVKETVLQTFGVELELEIRLLGMEF